MKRRTAGEQGASPLVGVVAIGRNEGERLRRCLESVRGLGLPTVYVDSGSSDDSVSIAESLDVEVVHLDTAAGFTAARARNAGYERLTRRFPGLLYVQFVDGDCEVVEGWIDAALRRLDQVARLAVVAGRRRERHPEASIFNRLCDMEWNTPIGPAKAVGGDAMYRVAAFDQVGGYDPGLICGEEPELCYRLRQAGWTVERLDHEMTLHDAAMTRWSQWWNRMIRSGWAYAEGAAIYGGAPERYNVRQTRSIWTWAVAVPAASVASLCLGSVLESSGLRAGLLATSLGAAGMLAYPAMALKVAWNRVATRADDRGDAWLYGVAVMLAKWPQLVGMLRYWTARWRGRQATIIEYKGRDSASASSARARRAR